MICIKIVSILGICLWIQTEAKPKKGEELYYNLDVPEGIHTHLTEEDFSRAKYVYSKRFERSASNNLAVETTQKRPPMVNPNYFEGDIRKIGGTVVKPHDKIDKIELNSKGTLKESTFRNAIREGAGSEYYKWPAPQIPYTVDARYSSYSRSRIANALDEYGQSTCVQFVPKTCETDYVAIKPIDGCFSDVGKAGGEQELSLESGCFEKGTILHELTHTAGFFHEQSRTDRDLYVKILWENIETGYEDQFQKYNAIESDNQGINYDYKSLMHYSSTAFGKPISRGSDESKVTILAKQPGAVIGQRDDFSPLDIQEIKLLYNCTAAGLSTAKYTPECASTSSSSCLDKRGDCQFLAKFSWPIGSSTKYCDSQRSFMQANCPKSCGLCTKTLTVTNCSDNFSGCPGWGAIYCNNSSFRTFMQSNCKKTCNSC